jgi:hypothetical protein
VLVHEQNVSLGAAHHRLVDGVAEQSLEKAAFAAADDDEVGVPLVGDLEQPLRRIAQLRYSVSTSGLPATSELARPAAARAPPAPVLTRA